MKFRMLLEQSQVDVSVGVIAQNDLPGIATLRNMMRNIHDHQLVRTEPFLKR